MNYLVIDTESGSRHANSTLLTANFLVADSKFQVLDNLYLQVKPDKSDDHYILDAQGMAVNQINIIEHDKIAITYKQAKPLLFDFLLKHSKFNKERLVPVGHATKGDIQRIIANLISEGSWSQSCTYHYIDTSVVLQFLRSCGKMPLDTDGSIEALSKYFDIEPRDIGDNGEYTNYHDAKFDTEMTLKIYQKMVELGKGESY